MVTRARSIVIPAAALGCLVLVGLRNAAPIPPAPRVARIDTAVPPTIIRHQMRLTDSGGVAINQAGLTVTIRLYNGDSIVADELFSEEHTVTVTDGFLSLEVGSVEPGGIPDSVFEEQGELWLGVQVSPDADEMTPRMRISSVPYALRAQVAQEALNFTPGAGIPTGTILMSGSSSAPAGFLVCDGSVQQVGDFPELAAAIGNTYGGDGVTTFAVPDLRGRFPLGLADSGTGSSLGASGGTLDHDHEHNHDNIHNHAVPGHYHGDGDLSIANSGSHNHGLQRWTAPNSGSGNSFIQAGSYIEGGVGPYPIGNAQVIRANTHSHSNGDFQGNVGATSSGNNGDTGFNVISTSIFTGTEGSTNETNNPPFLAVRYIIKA